MNKYILLHVYWEGEFENILLKKGDIVEAEHTTMRAYGKILQVGIWAKPTVPEGKILHIDWYYPQSTEQVFILIQDLKIIS